MLRRNEERLKRQELEEMLWEETRKKIGKKYCDDLKERKKNQQQIENYERSLGYGVNVPHNKTSAVESDKSKKFAKMILEEVGNIAATASVPADKTEPATCSAAPILSDNDKQYLKHCAEVHKVEIVAKKVAKEINSTMIKEGKCVSRQSAMKIAEFAFKLGVKYAKGEDIDNYFIKK